MIDVTELSSARPALLTRLRNRVALVVFREQVRGQGQHVDPEKLGPGHESRATWSAAKRRAIMSPTMARFADALRPPTGGTVREGVIGDLAEYYQITPEQALERCLAWEEASVDEWDAAPRDSEDGITDFYNTVESWSYDLLWYAYLQSEGLGYPESVIVADAIQPHPEGGRACDLGSGAGITAQLFAALGYDVTLADISSTLLGFAKWRLERRGVKADFVHLPADLPRDHFDLVTALDVIAHVPDVHATARQIRDSLHDGGLFVANFDVRRHSPENAWHLYEDDLPLRWAVQRAGFVPVRLIDGQLWLYRACERSGARWAMRRGLAWTRLASPPARLTRAGRRALARLILAVLRRGRSARSSHRQAG